MKSTNNITESMLCFRDAAVHTWNYYLRTSNDPMSADIQFSRDKIEIELLKVMVLNALNVDIDIDKYRSCAIREISVSPIDIYTEIPVLVGKVCDYGNTSWLECVLPVTEEFPTLSFRQFFDWNSYGHVSMNLVQAISMDDGRLYLIEDRFCLFKRRN